ncbi:hypothetical protein GCM10010168_77150 [Actinoplanes ianthinogenes]|uniref:Type VII secretion protein EccE n=1 Tax=Actinoplanes ianthinogenes TaxID=122358 RepID=A0ABM7M9M6_9ACTN|nr:hypothetical protein [Actinoplanes ianthinogenes]BCJ48359.1 hypothetical protein Aiant_90160 [Actinoplanes ianthinogenes]GGR46914.1 hypothetical protein GCM10010168_77150 [Actinoplanes ianthinogenes]
MFRWTGRGWIGVLLWLTVPLLALALAVATSPDHLLVWFAVYNVVIGVPAQILVGRAINTRQTPQGPVVTGEHLQQSVPVQRAWFWYWVIGLIAAGAELWTSGHTTVVWVLGILGVIALFVQLGWATHDQRHPSSPDGEFIAARVAGDDDGREPVARTTVPNREFRAALLERWAAYGAAADKLTPTAVTTGTVDGVAFTVFTTTDLAGGLLQLAASTRNVCLVHLPVVLPDLRLRPRLRDEWEAGEFPPVASEPPWNCDLVLRAHANSTLENLDDPGTGLVAEADVPGFAEAMVTPEVIEASVRTGITHWRVHGQDLLFVTVPGSGVLTEAESTAVVTGLAQIAKAFPQETLHRFGTVPSA